MHVRDAITFGASFVVALGGLLAGCGDDATSSASGSGGDGGGPSSSSSTGATGGGASTSTSAGSGGGSPNGSAGCGTPTSEATGSWLAKTADVAGATRDYFVYLPPGYDPSRAYPVVYQFHGCSTNPDKESNNVPIETESGADAIIVRGRAASDCWDTSADGPDVAFFDAMVSATEAAYCADTGRRFVAGYSSGSFMTHLLSCIRGAEIRGVASIAGGQGGSSCTGKVAALLIHDENDNTVNISASIAARDRYLGENGCADTTMPFDPSPCQAYDGCAAGLPVVWCQTSGQDHSRQDGLAAPAFWSFLSKL
jgi:poly(3-hydroxybutyrate) depolymerase